MVEPTVGLEPEIEHWRIVYRRVVDAPPAAKDDLFPIGIVVNAIPYNGKTVQVTFNVLQPAGYAVQAHGDVAQAPRNTIGTDSQTVEMHQWGIGRRDRLPSHLLASPSKAHR